MNEEYYIYYRNPFRRIWNALLSARQNIINMEEQSRSERLRSDMTALYQLKRRYDSDKARVALLKSMIATLQTRIDSLEAEMANSLSTRSDSIDKELARLHAAIKRRTSECDRLCNIMEEALDSVGVSEGENIAKPRRNPCIRMSARISAAVL